MARFNRSVRQVVYVPLQAVETVAPPAETRIVYMVGAGGTISGPHDFLVVAGGGAVAVKDFIYVGP